MNETKELVKFLDKIADSYTWVDALRIDHIGLAYITEIKQRLEQQPRPDEPKKYDLKIPGDEDSPYKDRQQPQPDEEFVVVDIGEGIGKIRELKANPDEKLVEEVLNIGMVCQSNTVVAAREGKPENVPSIEGEARENIRTLLQGNRGTVREKDIDELISNIFYSIPLSGQKDMPLDVGDIIKNWLKSKNIEMVE